jgi:hypothetical protein
MGLIIRFRMSEPLWTATKTSMVTRAFGLIRPSSCLSSITSHFSLLALKIQAESHAPKGQVLRASTRRRASQLKRCPSGHGDVSNGPEKPAFLRPESFPHAGPQGLEIEGQEAGREFKRENPIRRIYMGNPELSVFERA